jgi:hypothetical protein
MKIKRLKKVNLQRSMFTVQPSSFNLHLALTLNFCIKNLYILYHGEPIVVRQKGLPILKK